MNVHTYAERESFHSLSRPTMKNGVTTSAFSPWENLLSLFCFVIWTRWSITWCQVRYALLLVASMKIQKVNILKSLLPKFSISSFAFPYFCFVKITAKKRSFTFWENPKVFFTCFSLSSRWPIGCEYRSSLLYWTMFYYINRLILEVFVPVK